MNLLLGIGVQEMVLIVIVLLILFGGKKLPELMRGAGRGIREFKDSMNGKNPLDDVDKSLKDETKSISDIIDIDLDKS